MLEVRDLRVFRGGQPVLQGLSFVVHPGEIVALLGRNGAGRSTTAMALMGLLPRQGHIYWHGQPLQDLPAHLVARAGLGYVPESRDVFPGLSVAQNLLLGEPAQRRGSPPLWTRDELLGLFPALSARLHTQADKLSGGEQQMLSLCRTLLGQPQVLLVDEPAEGLSPQVVAQLGHVLDLARQRGLAVLLIEQKLQLTLALADRALVMGAGRIVADLLPDEVLASGACAQWLMV
ncbi:ABC transporter ATP-binding protein [Limnohabitans sp.]|uniref:ABC transporter ATP-binding protein n=1 Tax=Limnohabitans sp. TaxID=1907725 RepID=UPI00311E2203